jgi:hypothetical protein
MPRLIVIDRTILEQINRGNKEVAKPLRSLVDSNAQIWISSEDYKQGTQADQELIGDLKINVSASDDYMNNRVTQQKLNRLPLKSMTAGGLAQYLGEKNKQDAEVMTMDRDFRREYGAYYGKTVRELDNKWPMDGRTDYNQARRLMQLGPKNITNDGRVIAGEPPNPSEPPEVRPMQNRKPVEIKPDPKKDAKFQGAVIALQGVNYALHYINDKIQADRADDYWEKIRPSVEAALAADPSQGVLIITYYSRNKGDEESPIKPVAIFQYITISFGYTEWDALDKFRKKPSIAPAGTGEMFSESVWVRPRKPVDAKKLPTPFPSMGLATFAKGRAKVMGVEFSWAHGFDDTREKELDTSGGGIPQFICLKIPDQIEVNKCGVFGASNYCADSYDVETTMVNPRSVDSEALKGYRLKAVDLDCSHFWCGSTKAVMVYPADEATEALFARTPKVNDKYGLLTFYDFEHIRFVEPENIHLLRHWYGDGTGGGSPAPSDPGSINPG